MENPIKKRMFPTIPGINELENTKWLYFSNIDEVIIIETGKNWSKNKDNLWEFIFFNPLSEILPWKGTKSIERIFKNKTDKK